VGSASVVALVEVVLKGWVGGSAEDCGAGGGGWRTLGWLMAWSGIALVSSLIISVEDLKDFFIVEELEGCCCLDVVLWHARALETCTGPRRTIRFRAMVTARP